MRKVGVHFFFTGYYLMRCQISGGEVLLETDDIFFTLMRAQSVTDLVRRTHPTEKLEKITTHLYEI